MTIAKRDLTAELASDSQYVTIELNGRPVATAQRARVYSTEPAWTVYALNGAKLGAVNYRTVLANQAGVRRIVAAHLNAKAEADEAAHAADVADMAERAATQVAAELVDLETLADVRAMVATFDGARYRVAFPLSDYAKGCDSDEEARAMQEQQAIYRESVAGAVGALLRQADARDSARRAYPELF